MQQLLISRRHTSITSPSPSINAADAIVALLTKGQPITSAALAAVMTTAYGGSDATGAWTWKDAYDAGEIATVRFLRTYGRSMRLRAADTATLLRMYAKLAALLPTHTKRTEESQSLQQFSTPIELGLVAATAAGLTSDDIVLEPSAGTGLLAIHAELAGARLILNEYSERRAVILSSLFAAPVTRYDAKHIDDRLDAQVVPTAVLMNPPFSADVHIDRTVSDAALAHMRSALVRLAPGGRLVAITGHSLCPAQRCASFADLQRIGTVVFTRAIDGSVYRKHGTTFDCRLTVIDRVPAPDRAAFLTELPVAATALELLDSVHASVPPRRIIAGTPERPTHTLLRPSVRPTKPHAHRTAAVTGVAEDLLQPLIYTAIERVETGTPPLTDALYEPYTPQRISIAGALPHPTPLVQSSAMASVRPPLPSYRPRLAPGLVTDGVLSEPQLESIIAAGEAHSAHLSGTWAVDPTCDKLEAVPETDPTAVRFRRGFMLGDGTGAGKGRQAAGIILDNWNHGRRRALWLSRSDKLIEDAQRDWKALGQEPLLITPLSRFKQGEPIRLADGILFATYATLRSEGRNGKPSRVEQIVNWLGRDLTRMGLEGQPCASKFDGVIIFDESHAMANAAGESTERGDKAGSLQGRAGLRLQHALPDARVVYISATGATSVHNLAYAQRLGLWRTDEFPFATREEFVSAIEAGGVAAMEVLARDLKALGLYSARSLSYQGVEYSPLLHELTAAQTDIYDAYARAFEIIHNNLDAALTVTGINRDGEGAATRSLAGALRQAATSSAKAAARSAFESAKQRFFLHLITSMAVPSLIAAIDDDLANGRAPVIQIVSTSEAVMERRLAEIPPAEWNDLSIDITPREYVLDYLKTSFPVALHETYTTDDGSPASRAVVDAEGNPVMSREACALRDSMIEHLCTLPPVQGALDQIVHRYGTDLVAEVTGRSRRIVRKGERLCVETRPPSVAIAETHAFQNDDKKILIFSDAGGTGRSYHADLGARNQRQRVHYLLEPGWRADNAIQGLGRTNRTNQAQPPLFRPVATNIKGQKRFLSTIARRLDTLGAITKGQRETGTQGLFHSSDNLESDYARHALRALYHLIYLGKIEGCSLGRFQKATGLRLTDKDGSLLEELPPMRTFLNRLLALEIATQNAIFDVFEGLLQAKIESAIAAGVYERGLETITAESLSVTDRQSIYTHHGTKAETSIVSIARKTTTVVTSADEALGALRRDPRCTLLVNAKSGNAAVRTPAPSITLDDGTVEARWRLVRPKETYILTADAFARSTWRAAHVPEFTTAWTTELEQIPKLTEDTLHVVTGLLLPIWDRLPPGSARVYRMQMDDGERIIGRLVNATWVNATLEREAPIGTAGEEWARLNAGTTTLELAHGLALSRTRVMGSHRIEVTGFGQGHLPRLRSFGLFTEIIQWSLRLFVPVGDAGADPFARLVDSYPMQSVAERAP